MAWFEDSSPCDYFGQEIAPLLRAVGWLEHGKAYSQGVGTSPVFAKLRELLSDPWQPAVFMGSHPCDLCRFEPEAQGCNNLFIPGTGFIYVCPELIVHYLNAHHYAPPPEFCAAVLACPPMRSMEYRRAILGNGGRLLVKLQADG